jgi:DNA-binding transcriptional MerR regulator
MFDGLRDLQGRAFELDELVKAVNRQIARAGFAPEDERVSAQADARTVRYYQSLGLVSKPDRYDGRQAIYGYQHLLQLVAVKALQAQGLSLEQIRAWLPDQPVVALQAALAGSLDDGRGLGAVKPAAPLGVRLNHQDGNPSFHQGELPSRSPMPADLSAFRLAPGVDLLIDPAQVIDPQGLARRLQVSLEGQG